MLNISNESQKNQKNQLHKIIHEYLSINQQTENTFMSSVQLAESAFLNQWKQLNQQRLHNQNANWSNFLHKLQQLNAIQSVSNNTNQYNNKQQSSLSHSQQTNTVKSLSVPSPKPSSPTPNDTSNDTKKMLKATELFVCRLKGCTKKYTTKGNLNRHLKDFHRLNPDLRPMTMDEVHNKSKKKKNTDNEEDNTSQFNCIHLQCRDHKGFNNVNSIKEHGINMHNITEDEISQYISNCKQNAVRRNTASPLASSNPSSIAHVLSHKHKRPNFIHKNAFDGTDAHNNDAQLNMLMALNKNANNNGQNPFCAQTQITNTNGNGLAQSFPAFIVNKNNTPINVSMLNFAANNHQNKLNPQQRQMHITPLTVLNNNQMRVHHTVNAAQMNRMNQMNINNMLMNKQNINMNAIPVPMLQILAKNGSNNTLNAALMQISAMNNNNKINGMKNLITEILKKNNTPNNNNNNNTLNRIQTMNRNNPDNRGNNSNMNANINVKNDDKYDGLNALLQAVDALDQNKEDRDNDDDTESKQSTNKMKCSRKRKIEANNIQNIKRRKLNNCDERIGDPKLI